jgi:hypothetical protein
MNNAFDMEWMRVGLVLFLTSNLLSRQKLQEQLFVFQTEIVNGAIMTGFKNRDLRVSCLENGQTRVHGLQLGCTPWCNAIVAAISTRTQRHNTARY